MLENNKTIIMKQKQELIMIKIIIVIYNSTHNKLNNNLKRWSQQLLEEQSTIFIRRSIKIIIIIYPITRLKEPNSIIAVREDLWEFIIIKRKIHLCKERIRLIRINLEIKLHISNKEIHLYPAAGLTGIQIINCKINLWKIWI